MSSSKEFFEKHKTKLLLSFSSILLLGILTTIIVVPLINQNKVNANCHKINNNDISFENYDNNQLAFKYKPNIPTADYVEVKIKDKDIENHYLTYLVPYSASIPVWFLYENYQNEITLNYYTDIAPYQTLNSGQANTIGDEDVLAGSQTFTYQTCASNRSDTKLATQETDLDSIYKENFLFVVEELDASKNADQGKINVYDRFGNARLYLNNETPVSSFSNSGIGLNIGYNEYGYLDSVYIMNSKLGGFNNSSQTNNPKINLTYSTYGLESKYDWTNKNTTNVSYSHDFTIDSDGQIYFFSDPLNNLQINTLVKIAEDETISYHSLTEIIFDLSSDEFNKINTGFLVNNGIYSQKGMQDLFAMNSIEYDPFRDSLILNSRSLNAVFSFSASDLEFEWAFTTQENFAKIEELFSQNQITFKNKEKWIVHQTSDESQEMFGEHSVVPTSYNQATNELTLIMLDNHYRWSSVSAFDYNGNDRFGGSFNHNEESYYKQFTIDLDSVGLAQDQVTLDYNVKINASYYEGSAFPFYQSIDNTYFLYTYQYDENGYLDYQYAITDLQGKTYWTIDMPNDYLTYRALPLHLKTENYFKTSFKPYFI